MRVVFAALGGLCSYEAFGNDYSYGLLTGIIFYMGSYYVARLIWFRKLAKEDVGKIYSTGIGGFVLVFLFTWILLFTLVSA
jgi:hypothetical protein